MWVTKHHHPKLIVDVDSLNLWVLTESIVIINLLELVSGYGPFFSQLYQEDAEPGGTYLPFGGACFHP